MNHNQSNELHQLNVSKISSIENDTRLSEMILDAIKNKATSIDLYSRLSKKAPNFTQQNEILQILEDEQFHIQQLNKLYQTITGQEPNYSNESLPFQTYQEGLERGYLEKIKAYDGERNTIYTTDSEIVSEVLTQICLDDLDHVQRLETLHYSINEDHRQQKDFGPNPFVVNIDKVTEANNTFRTALWTGRHLQVTLMSIGIGEDIGLEIHPNLDQFLRIEQGRGRVEMGRRQNQMNFKRDVREDFAIFVPAGTWHNVKNTGNVPLKLYSIYAPPQHPKGTVHKTKADAMAAEMNH